MASISTRNGKFLVRVRRDGFKAAAKTFTRKQDAMAWGRMVEAAMESGRWRDPGKVVPTMADAIRVYRASTGAKLKGRATYAYWLDELSGSSLGPKRIDQVTPADLATWRDRQLESGLKPGTVVRKLGMLSGLLTWCHKERGWITANPARSISKPKVSDARTRILSTAEYDHLLAAAGTGKAKWLADSIAVLAFSGMRRGELWSLRPTDINFDESIARLNDTKNGCARDVPLCPTALGALKRLCIAASLEGSERLIPVCEPQAISLAFRRTVTRARNRYFRTCSNTKVEPDASFLHELRLHDLRHTAVTRWARTGELSMLELAAVSGHRGLVSLKRYSHLTAEHVAAKLACLSASSI